MTATTMTPNSDNSEQNYMALSIHLNRNITKDLSQVKIDAIVREIISNHLFSDEKLKKIKCHDIIDDYRRCTERDDYSRLCIELKRMLPQTPNINSFVMTKLIELFPLTDLNIQISSIAPHVLTHLIQNNHLSIVLSNLDSLPQSYMCSLFTNDSIGRINASAFDQHLFGDVSTPIINGTISIIPLILRRISDTLFATIISAVNWPSFKRCAFVHLSHFRCSQFIIVAMHILEKARKRGSFANECAVLEIDSMFKQIANDAVRIEFLEKYASGASSDAMTIITEIRKLVTAQRPLSTLYCIRELKAIVNRSAKNYHTPLTTAIRGGNRTAVKFILYELSANPYAPDANKTTPHQALQKFYNDMHASTTAHGAADRASAMATYDAMDTILSESREAWRARMCKHNQHLPFITDDAMEISDISSTLTSDDDFDVSQSSTAIPSRASTRASSICGSYSTSPDDTDYDVPLFSVMNHHTNDDSEIAGVIQTTVEFMHCTNIVRTLLEYVRDCKKNDSDSQLTIDCSNGKCPSTLKPLQMLLEQLITHADADHCSKFIKQVVDRCVYTIDDLKIIFGCMYFTWQDTYLPLSTYILKEICDPDKETYYDALIQIKSMLLPEPQPSIASVPPIQRTASVQPTLSVKGFHITTT